MRVNTFKKGIDYRIDLSLNYVTLGGLLKTTSEISSYLGDILTTSSNDNYLNAVLVTRLLEIIPKIKEDFENSPTKKIQVTKQIAYVLGDVTSFLVSYGFDGINFYFTLGLNLLKNRGTTFIINKLEHLRQIDGISCAIIINTLFSIPKLIKSFCTPFMITNILVITSIASLFSINYAILKTKDSIPIIFTNGREESLEVSVTNSYTTSILLCSIVEKLLEFFKLNIINNSIIFILVTPIITFILSNDLHSYGEKISEYLQKNEGLIPGYYPGKATKKYLEGLLKNSNIAYSIIGCLVFILTNQIIVLFNLEISAINLALIVNSIFTVRTNIKSIKSIKKTKGFLKEGIL